MPTIDQQEDFQVGTKIKFLQALTSSEIPAPGFYQVCFCDQDELGEIVSVRKNKQGQTEYEAMTNAWPIPFPILRSEFISI